MDFKYILYFFVAMFIVAAAFAADQVDFPDIYIDADAGDGGVGSQADPYNEFSDINWTTGGDNSIYDYINGTPSQDVTINLQRGDEWHEMLDVGTGGNSSYSVVIQPYGTGDDPVIIGASLMTGWTNESGNLWYASAPSNPGQIYLVNTDTSILWGFRKDTKGACTASQYWWWDSGNSRVYLYSTSDPDTAYSDIYRNDTNIGIDIEGNFDYITIDGIEIKFFGSYGYDAKGIRTYAGPSYITIENCHIHHIGNLDIEQGLGMMLIGDHFTVENNEVHDCGRRGINIYTAGSYSTSNATLRYNKVYNCYHTGFDIMVGNSSTTISNVTVSHNELFCDENYNDHYGNNSCYCIHLAGKSGGTLSNTYVHNNIIHGYATCGIGMDLDLNGIYVYNNSIYEKPNTQNLWGLYVLNNGSRTNINFSNNSIHLNGDSSGDRCYNFTSTSAISNDYNICYNPSGYVMNGYQTWSAYRSAFPSFDANGYNENPDYTNPGNGNLTLQFNAPGINTGDDLGASYDDALDPSSTWPSSVSFLDQDDYGTGWEIGAYVFGSSPDTDDPYTYGHNPSDGANNVAKTADIVVVIGDDGDGVDISTIVLHEEGNKHCCSGETCTSGTADLTCSGTSADYTVTLGSRNYDYDQVINVTVDADDLAGTPNSMTQDVYSYTIESEPGDADISISVGAGNMKMMSGSGNLTLSQ
jgi:hypothetical protein